MQTGKNAVFFTDTIAPDATHLTLEGPEGVHAAKVRRIRIGESIRIADGHGRFADCVVTSVAARSLVAEVTDHGFEQPRLPKIVVVQAIPKIDRATLAVELLTEGGVDAIVPWSAANCVARWEDPAKRAKGVLRWQQTAREAAKQSRRSRIPRVEQPANLADIVTMCATSEVIVLHESAKLIIDHQSAPRDCVTVVVGPEGGISPVELAQLAAAGAQIRRLGPEVMRTSSAAFAAIAILSHSNGRWA